MASAGGSSFRAAMCLSMCWTMSWRLPQSSSTNAPSGAKLRHVKDYMMRLRRAAGHTSFENLAQLLQRRGSPDFALIELARSLTCKDCAEVKRKIGAPPASTLSSFRTGRKRTSPERKSTSPTRVRFPSATTTSRLKKLSKKPRKAAVWLSQKMLEKSKEVKEVNWRALNSSREGGVRRSASC